MPKSIRTLSRNIILALLILVGSQTHLHAQGGCTSGGTGCPASAPEIDPSVAAGGLAMLAGIIVLVRGRRKR